MTNEEVTVHDFRYDEGFRNRVEQVCPTLTAHMGGTEKVCLGNR